MFGDSLVVATWNHVSLIVRLSGGLTLVQVTSAARFLRASH